MQAQGYKVGVKEEEKIHQERRGKERKSCEQVK